MILSAPFRFPARTPAARPRSLFAQGGALVLAAVLLALGTSLAPAPLQAQEGGDLRWLPWVGCWEPTDEVRASWEDAPSWDDEEGAPAPAPAPSGSSLLVCVTQVEGGVQVETLVDGEAASVELIRTDGTPVVVEEGGCEGARQAHFASDGRRVFVVSDLNCGADARRTTRGVFAMGSDGLDWVEIQGVGTEVGGEADPWPYLSVRRFHAASRATLARHEREVPATDQGLAVDTSRRVAARPLSAAAVLEAHQVTGPEVTSALVAEMGHPFDLDARTLRTLRDGGVGPEVLDMMIAMTWPDQFQVGFDGSVAPQEQAYAPAQPRDVYGTSMAMGWSPACTWWFGRCAGFGLSLRYSSYAFDRYGYYPYGSAGWWGYQPRSWYTGPRYIVVGPGTTPRQGGTMTSDGYRPAGGGQGNVRPGTTRTGATSGTTQSAPQRPAASTGTANARPPAAGSSTTNTDRRPAQRRTGGGGGGG